MSARREARARNLDSIASGAGGVPRVFLVGRCIEVWADPAESTPHSAMRRFSKARAWWLDQVGIEDRESLRLVEVGLPWSAEYLFATGRGPETQTRLARAGCTRTDVPVLAEEAEALHRRALQKG